MVIGNWRGKGDLKAFWFKFKHGFLFKILIALVSFVFLFLLAVVLVPLPKPLFKNDYSTVVLGMNGEILRIFLNSEEQWIFPPDKYYKIPDKLKKAVIIAEDKNFYSHLGVDLPAIFRAMKQNISAKRVISGASTITMQVARLVKPKRRTLLNKILETFQAIKIEVNYSKDEILLFYLNNAPFGGNIRGVAAAASKYYGKKPEKLTWSEACTLAVLPNAPGLISPDLNSKHLFSKKNKLLKKLLNNKVISNWDYETAINEPVPEKSIKFSIIAPHFTRIVKNKKTGEVVKTTIDSQIQDSCLNIAKIHNNFLKGNGINNLSVIVAETKSGNVRAYIGSQDFFNEKNSGQVDGATAPRSTGSILKPFLYAKAIDEGILIPKSLIKDIPTYYGAYTPTNANKMFDGLVTMEDALIRSLNVPAARTLREVGVDNFYDFLKSADISTLKRDPFSYGIPLILGGAEANLVDLTALYRGLGNFGDFSKLKYFESEKGEKPKKLLSDGACYLILNTLKRLKRPGFEYYWQMYQNQKPVAWKTGTSYGQRDGWAIGVTPTWTVAVWVGNFSGVGNQLLTGATCAGPILFDIVNILTSDNNWFTKPKTGLKKVKICKNTGFAATESCPETDEYDVPFQMKPLLLCPYHKKNTVTQDEQNRVCSLCWTENNHKIISTLQYPAPVVEVLRKRGEAVYNLPSHNPKCSGIHKESILEITYPLNNSKIFVPIEMGGVKQKLTCRASHTKANSTIYWYLNGVYLGETSKDHTQTISLSKGKNKLMIIDEEGNESFVTFFTY